ncbi:hypothetical protein [Salinibacterium sp. PAMC 21357]|uniref:hypothetical protein n=1 Tax=Salinibacterium sp. PAMC 21357 TaxID=1112215 RepID=UPI0002D4990D|nr:hypothetical protein [Salinibacterium sp. PAMC 21357]
MSFFVNLNGELQGNQVESLDKPVQKIVRPMSTTVKDGEVGCPASDTAGCCRTDWAAPF